MIKVLCIQSFRLKKEWRWEHSSTQNAPQIENSELVWLNTSCLRPQEHSNKVFTISNEDYKFFGLTWKTFSKECITLQTWFSHWRITRNDKQLELHPFCLGGCMTPFQVGGWCTGVAPFMNEVMDINCPLHPKSNSKWNLLHLKINVNFSWVKDWMPIT